MTVITSSATLTIADAAIETASITLTVIPAAPSATGRGRLIHPALGTYDYERPPDDWTNMRGDAIIAPIWASQKTLLGAANTLFVGDLRDVIVEERWSQPVACSSAHVDMLIAMWSNPPDPSAAYVQWWPSYTSNQGFNVVLLSLTLGGREITTHSLSHAGWERGPLTMRMRITARL